MKQILTLLTLVFFISCTTKEQDKKRYLPDSNGKINSMAVIIDNDLWNTTVGDVIRKHFAASLDGLPQEEPLFSIHQMPPVVFTDFARNSRHVLVIQKDKISEKGHVVKQDLYAKPQKVAIIKAATDTAIIALIEKHASAIIQEFKDHEVLENQKRFTRSLNKDTALEDVLGIQLTLPSVYKVVKQEHNFFWIKRPLKGGEAGILVYDLPYASFAITEQKTNRITAIRDSIGKKYIPGREPGMYMITEKGFAPNVYHTVISDREVVESRGIWEMKDFLMAGPFVNYIIADKPNKRWVVVEGFVSAPSIEKRDYIFELESIAKSIVFKK